MKWTNRKLEGQEANEMAQRRLMSCSDFALTHTLSHTTELPHSDCSFIVSAANVAYTALHHCTWVYCTFPVEPCTSAEGRDRSSWA